MTKLIDWEGLRESLSPEDYEAISKQILEKLEPKVRSYTPILMLDRGLGREFRNLEAVKDITLKGADKQAKQLAEKYILQPGYEKAIILEVRLRPIIDG
jgi:hypothetical protein